MTGDLSGLTVLAVHPGAEMFGSDRMMLESVAGMVEGGARVVAALPFDGPLAARLEEAGATVRIGPAFVLRKALLRPSGWPRLVASLLRGAASAGGLIARTHPDVVYVSTIIEPLWPALGRLAGVPVVSHVHEAEATGPRIIPRILYGPHALSTRVIVNSRFTAGAIARVLPAVARRARIVPNGVEGPPRPTAAREALDGPVRLVYVDRLSPRKGPDLVLDAAAILAGEGLAVEVALVGDAFPGYEWYADQLHASAEALKAVSVHLAGFQADVWPWLAGADIAVVPSRADESFGNAVVEAVLAQRPVVASDMSGLHEAGQGYRSVELVPPDDPSAIAGAIGRLRDDWPAVVSSAPASRDLALRRHDPARYRAGVRRVVGEAAGARRRGERGMDAAARLAQVPRRAAKAVVRTGSRAAIGALGVDDTAAIASRPTLVVTPHPDDETFGCAATMARMRAAGTPVTLLVVSDGGDSPRPDGVDREGIIRLRRQETLTAMEALGVDGADVLFWDFEDGSVGSRAGELTDRLAGLLAGLAPDQVMVASALDRHPDHAAVGLATREAVGRTARRPILLEYPIWQRIPALAFLRRRARPDGAQRFDVLAAPRLCRSGPFLEHKRAAIAAYPSQLPHFPAGWVEDFLGPFEHFAQVRPR